MMKARIRNIAGLMLVLVGTLIGIANMDFLGDQAQSISVAVVYGVFGLVFLYLYQQNAFRRWMLVAAISAFGLAVIQVLGMTVMERAYVGPASLSLLALSLIVIVLMDFNMWWVLIPAFLLFSIGVSEWIDLGSSGIPTGGSLFFGTGLAFLVIYFIPEKYGSNSWSLVPAVLLLATGVLATYQDVTKAGGYLLPGLLLLAGGIALVLASRRSA